VLRDHPTAVVPYLVIRDHFTERLYHQRTGYWQPDGRGLEPVTAAEHAAALDLLAGGREEQFAAAANDIRSCRESGSSCGPLAVALEDLDRVSVDVDDVDGWLAWPDVQQWLASESVDGAACLGGPDHLAQHGGGPHGASALWPVPEAERSPGHRGGETVLPGPRP
jgi:hypothetical protein